jgi:adenylate cyclase
MRPANLDAWQYVQRGMADLTEFTKAAALRARDMFKRAVQLDPNYSRAHSGLAYTYMRDFWLGISKDRKSTVTKLLESGRRAVALDEADSLAHIALSFGYIWSNELTRAGAEAETAVRLNPSNAAAFACLGHVRAMCGDTSEGIRLTEKSLQLTPRDPRNHMFMIHVALAHMVARHHEAAANWARRAVDRNPNLAEYYFILASSLAHLGRVSEARRALETCERIDPNFISEWTASRPYLKPVDVAHCLDGFRKAGWHG